MIIHKAKRVESLIDTLVLLWEDSVRKSHFFLKNKDIIELIPFVKTGLYEIPHLILAKKENHIAGFMGIAKDKIEMLFISPEYFGQGIGKELVHTAIDMYHIDKVDVNEQNPFALSFYEHLGFNVFERTDHDDQGRPFPILRMCI